MTEQLSNDATARPPAGAGGAGPLPPPPPPRGSVHDQRWALASGALKEIALFSPCGAGVMRQLASSSRHVELADSSHLFREGDAATSFFAVAEGAVQIVRRLESRDVVLRNMRRGDAIGLLGLLSGRVRAACARAIGDASLVEVPAAALNGCLQVDAGLRGRVTRFYQERLLEAFLGASPLFADLDSIARGRLIGRFATRRLPAAETLVQPGEVLNLVAVVLSGRLMLEERSRVAEEPKLYELCAGEFLVVTGAMMGLPSRLRVYAEEPATVAVLGHSELADLIRDYPVLRGVSSKLPLTTRQLDRDIFCGHTGVPGL